MEESPLFKEYFNEARAKELADELYAVYPAFSRQRFLAEVLDGLDSLELKARVAHIAAAYRRHLPADYPEALEVLLLSLGPVLSDDKEITASGFRYWPLAHFIEVYGLDHPEESIRGMYEVTQRFSAEFAIRPYLLRYPERMLEVLRQWTQDGNLHVRRLVSEGSRTRLPWGQRLSPFIKDPAPLIPLLEALKTDPELYVRRSVANSLNDLSKDHPGLVVELAEQWWSTGHADTRWIVRHALRSLVKAGDPQALAILGFGAPGINVERFATSPSLLKLGQTLELTLELSNPTSEPEELLIDFRIHFVKANGSTAPKVFKWTKKNLAPEDTLTLTKRLSIRPISTRRYYSGLHKVEAQINGKVLAEAEFELVVGGTGSW